jgi:predicted aldo/keto reductase-like oxidoreductase
MQYTDLGSTGLRVSRISLGMEHVVKDLDAVEPVVDTAVQSGINYFDMMLWTAETKRDAGQALARHRHRGSAPLHRRYPRRGRPFRRRHARVLAGARPCGLHRLRRLRVPVSLRRTDNREHAGWRI